MGLFYLATLYCWLRGMMDVYCRIWRGMAVLACAAGMATKEVMVTAPVVLLLFDRMFIADSWSEIWRRRRGSYAALACTWVLLGFLMISTRFGSRVVGEGQVYSPASYLTVECGVILRYIKLVLWPGNLVFDYGPGGWDTTGMVARIPVVLIALLLGAGVVLFRRGSALGWSVVTFLVLLAPTSSVVPVTGQPMAESRLYLPLIPVVAFGVLAAYRVAARRSLVLCALVGVGLLGLTVRRNADYHSEISIWTDTVRKAPDNYRARNNLGFALSKIPGREKEAVAQYEAAVVLKPSYADAHDNLALLLARQPAERAAALQHYEAAMRFSGKADSAEAYNHLGNLLAGWPDRQADAMAAFERALRLRPDYAEAHNNLAVALANLPGRQAEAEAHYRAALSINPDYAAAHNNLANLLTGLPGKENEAVVQFKAALRNLADSAEVHANFASLLARLPGRESEALAQYDAALKIAPDFPEAHNNLGALLVRLPGRLPEAIRQFEIAVRLRPDYADAHKNLAMMIANQTGRTAEAVAHFEAALKTNPGDADAHYYCGVLLSRMPGRQQDAVEHLARALRIRPGFAEAKAALDRLR